MDKEKILSSVIAVITAVFAVLNWIRSGGLKKQINYQEGLIMNHRVEEKTVTTVEKVLTVELTVKEAETALTALKQSGMANLTSELIKALESFVSGSNGEVA